MTKKVIFLDVDGVLASMRSAAAFGGYPAAGKPVHWDRFDDVAIQMVHRAIHATGAEIVLSSDWRNDVNLDTLEYRLGFSIMDVTRAAVEADTRGHQIHDWLMAHPEVARYAILDDKEDLLPVQMDKLCRTSTRNGFLLGHYEELIELLGMAVDAEPLPA